MDKIDPKPSPEITTLLKRISEGKVILFLGAGANRDCINSKGEQTPIGNELVQKIKVRFFPGEDAPLDLKQICACVEARASRRELDTFLYDLLIGYQPSETLKTIARLPWRGIYTTNFDILVEKAYEQTIDKARNLHPIYSNRDRLDTSLGEDVLYVKLHGCITKISSPDLPLILTAEDYAVSYDCRRRLFVRLENDLIEHTILFVGYNLEDSNFTDLFYEIQKSLFNPQDFPRCYLVVPDMKKSLIEMWDSKKIKNINLTASDFFLLTKEFRVQPIATSTQQNERISTITSKVSPKLDQTIALDIAKSFELVSDRLGFESCDKETFYKGDKPSWALIRAKADAERTKYEEIMDGVILENETDKIDLFELAVITAEAGAGKSTLLMRLAYDHACSFDGFCLFFKKTREIPVAALEETYRLIKKRIFIYVDDASDHAGALSFLARRSTLLKLPITVICAERKNEWNVSKDKLFPIVPIEYELPYLDDLEIDNILKILETADCLYQLKDKSLSERRTIFKEVASKQLLVAMREATEGFDFDRIIQNEYENIPSELGRRTYLYICALHRLGVPVRAGLLQRISEVSFAEFNEKLFKPCERVIVVERDEMMQETYFRARHPYIADIVCKHAFRDPSDIAGVYLSILDKIDIGYDSDSASFQALVKADNIIDSLPTIEQRRLFYNRALSISGNAAYVYQHFGIMELRDKEGSIIDAEKYFSIACQLEPKNMIYKHSFAKLLIKKAKQAENVVQQDHFFKEAQKILFQLIESYPTNAYAYDSYAQNLINKADRASSPEKEEHLKLAHEVLLRGLRFCPDKSYLKTTEAKIFERLDDMKNAHVSLLKSHEIDPSSIRTAILLVRLLERKGELARANAVLQKALEYNRNDETLNFFAAKLTMKISPNEHPKIISFLKKAYDVNYIDSEANYLLAVEYFRQKNYDQALEIFTNFKKRKTYFREERSRQVREYLNDNQGNIEEFEGEITLMFPGNKTGLISPDKIPLKIFYRISDVMDRKAVTKMRVKFRIGFNLLGPIAQNIT